MLCSNDVSNGHIVVVALSCSGFCGVWGIFTHDLANIPFVVVASIDYRGFRGEWLVGVGPMECCSCKSYSIASLLGQ